MDTTANDDKDVYVWKITETTIIDDKYVKEELKREAEAFASGSGRNTGFCLCGLCGQDVSKIDMSNLSEEMFNRLTYDSKTKFSQEQIEKFHPDIIMEQGKQFGDTGKSGIDGSGTTIAIIDRFSDVSAKQFEGRTITVYRVSEDGVEEVQSNEDGIYLEHASIEEDGLENGYHGNTIASLTVGKKCGVAPKSNVVLFHIDGIGNPKAQNAVLKFIDENREKEGFTIPDIISVSAKTEINQHTLNELEELGCAFINSDIFMRNFTWGRSNDGNELVRDEFIQYTIDSFADRGIDINKLFNKNTLIPVTGRTSSYINDDGEEVYKYNGSLCGNSFAICQVAGMFLLAKQINPNIRYDEFIEIARDTAKTNKDNMKYLDADRIITKVKEMEKAKKILESGIKATEESTRTGAINGQVQTINDIEKAKTQENVKANEEVS